MGGRGKHTEILVHGIRMVCPGLELVFIEGELLGEGFNMSWVFVEEDLSVHSRLIFFTR